MRTANRARHRMSPNGSRGNEKKYSAFISYSSDPDGRSVAASLQHGLHRLAKKWYQLRAMHVFLDTSAGMAVGAPLWEELRTAMDASRYFVLIASPVAAMRPWVDREITYWLDRNPTENLIIVAGQGKIAWDDGRGDFDWVRTDMLPPALRGRYRDEPVFVDVRKVRRPLERKDPVLNDKIADVAARLHGVSKEEMTSRDRRERRRTLRLAGSAIAVLVISLAAALAASFIAIGQRDQAGAQARLALSRQLATEARTLLPQSADTAALLAVESYRMNPGPQARTALLDVLLGNPRLQRIRHLRLPASGGQLASDGTEVLAAGSWGVSVWDVASGRKIGPVFGSGTRRSASKSQLQYEGVLSPDGHRLAVYTPAGAIELWDPSRHRLIATSADPAMVTGSAAVGIFGTAEPQLIYSPDGQYILSTGLDGAYVFDAATLRRVAGPLKIPGNTPGVDTAAFDPDGRFLIVTNVGARRDFIFSTASWRVASSINDTDGANDFVFSPNGLQLAVLSGSGVRLDAVSQGKNGKPPRVTGPVLTMNGPRDPEAVAWSHDSSMLAISGVGGIQVWTPGTGQISDTLRVNLVVNGVGDVNGITFGRSDHYLLAGEADGLATWRLDRTNLYSLGGFPSVGPPAFGRDGKTIATADGADGVQLWNARSGESAGKPIHPGGGTVQSVAFIAGNTRLAVGEQVGTAIWDLKEDKQVGNVMAGFNRTVADESVSSDGRFAAAAESLEVSVWDLAARRIVLKIPSVGNSGPSALQAVVSPDGKLVAMPAGENVELWSIPRREKIAVIKAGDSVSAVAFAPDEAFLAVDTSTPTTQLWDLRHRRWLGLPMASGTSSANSLNENPVAISADSTMVASASGASDSITVWDSGSGAQLGVLTIPSAGSGQEDGVSGLAFSPTGPTLAATTSSGAFTVWDLDVRHWLADACAMAGRQLTRSEWTQYIGSIASYQQVCT